MIVCQSSHSDLSLVTIMISQTSHWPPIIHRKSLIGHMHIMNLPLATHHPSQISHWPHAHHDPPIGHPSSTANLSLATCTSWTSHWSHIIHLESLIGRSWIFHRPPIGKPSAIHTWISQWTRPHINLSSVTNISQRHLETVSYTSLLLRLLSPILSLIHYYGVLFVTSINFAPVHQALFILVDRLEIFSNIYLVRVVGIRLHLGRVYANCKTFA